MIRVILIQLSILQTLFALENTYGEKQITKILDEYFLSFKSSPSLLGHKFYKNSNEMVFQLEIETDSAKVNNALLFGFDTISKLSNISKIKVKNEHLHNLWKNKFRICERHA